MPSPDRPIYLDYNATTPVAPEVADRMDRAVRDLWDELVRRGTDAHLLRERSLVTPHCGLGMHTAALAEQVCRVTREVGARVGAWIPRSGGAWA